MNAFLDAPSIARATLVAAIPLLYLLAALTAGNGGQTARDAWVWARRIASLTVVAALLSMLWLVFSEPFVVYVPIFATTSGDGSMGLGVRLDHVGATVLLLVSFIGWIIVRYSHTYLVGDPDQPRYVRYLMATLAAVAVVVITNNLAVLAIAWTAASLAVHQLLTFYQDRQPALIAAHKKFIASRVADLCLISAVVLISMNLGTLEIDELLQRAQALSGYSAGLRVAVVLIVITALLKCAQLPVHGWLIQVMEAPTPVSALLHAGVVNLGGFVLIRLSPLVSAVPLAQALLVVVGSATAGVAALVMMTRISIKVNLAWSTCAQMGFMLMQCGLGLYELALLHLVAHSLYKAHAFLAAGGAVEQARLQRLLPQLPSPGMLAACMGAFFGVMVVTAAALLWRVPLHDLPALWAMGVIVSLALTPFLIAQVMRTGALWSLALGASAFSVAWAYFGLHFLLGRWIDLPASGTPAGWGLACVTLGTFVLLFVVQTLIRTRPRSFVARGLYPWFYSGLFLDEAFTRITFRLWPARPSRNRDVLAAAPTTGAPQ